MISSLRNSLPSQINIRNVQRNNGPPSHLVQVIVSSLLQDPEASPSAPIVLWCFHSKWRPFRSLHGTPVYLQFLWVFSYNLTQNSHSRIWMRFSMSPRPRNTATTSLMNFECQRERTVIYNTDINLVEENRPQRTEREKNTVSLLVSQIKYTK